MHYDLLGHQNYVRIYVYFVSYLFVMSTLRPQNTLIYVQLGLQVASTVKRKDVPDESRKSLCIWRVMLLKLTEDSISEADNGIEFKLQYDIDHGPQWNAHRFPYKHLTGT